MIVLSDASRLLCGKMRRSETYRIAILSHGHFLCVSSVELRRLGRTRCLLNADWWGTVANLSVGIQARLVNSLCRVGCFLSRSRKPISQLHGLERDTTSLV